MNYQEQQRERAIKEAYPLKEITSVDGALEESGLAGDHLGAVVVLNGNGETSSAATRTGRSRAFSRVSQNQKTIAYPCPKLIDSLSAGLQS